ncbi:hypothetical protein GJ496_009552 [Pomphorhynchus laevis]|nr:hypothetical protein GJ496_009552 [Pomphorhynchus laevis]
MTARALSMGLSFIPTPATCDRLRISKALNIVASGMFPRKMDTITRNDKIEKLKKWMWCDYIKTNEKHKYRPNISKSVAEGLKSLQARNDVKITKADKGPQAVIWKLDDYSTEALRQLNDATTYCQVEASCIQVCRTVNDLLDIAVSKQQLDVAKANELRPIKEHPSY